MEYFDAGAKLRIAFLIVWVPRMTATVRRGSRVSMSIIKYRPRVLLTPGATHCLAISVNGYCDLFLKA